MLRVRRRRDHSRAFNLILPTEEVVYSATKLIRDPELYGTTMFNLAELSMEVWADLNGWRRPGYIYYTPDFLGFDPILAIQSRIADDVIDPIGSQGIDYDELIVLAEDLTSACLTIYLDIDHCLSRLGLPGEGRTSIDEMQWLSYDLALLLDLL